MTTKYFVRAVKSPFDFLLVDKHLFEHKIALDRCTAVRQSSSMFEGMIVGFRKDDVSDRRDEPDFVVRVQIETLEVNENTSDLIVHFQMLDEIGFGVERWQQDCFFELPNLETCGPFAVHKARLSGIVPMINLNNGNKQHTDSSKISCFDEAEERQWSPVAGFILRKLIKDADDVIVYSKGFSKKDGLHLVCIDVKSVDGKLQSVSDVIVAKGFGAICTVEPSCCEDEDDERSKDVCEFVCNTKEFVCVRCATGCIRPTEVHNIKGVGQKIGAQNHHGIKRFRAQQMSERLSHDDEIYPTLNTLLLNGIPNIVVYHRDEEQLFKKTMLNSLSKAGKSIIVCESATHCNLVNDWLRQVFDHARNCFVISSSATFKSNRKWLSRYILLITIPNVAEKIFATHEIVSEIKIIMFLHFEQLVQTYASAALNMFKKLGESDRIAQDTEIVSVSHPATIIVHFNEYNAHNEQQMVKWLFPAQVKKWLESKKKQCFHYKPTDICGPFISIFSSPLTSLLAVEREQRRPEIILKLFDKNNKERRGAGAYHDLYNSILIACTSTDQTRVAVICSNKPEKALTLNGLRSMKDEAVDAFEIYTLDELMSIACSCNHRRIERCKNYYWIAFDLNNPVDLQVDTLIMLAAQLNPRQILFMFNSDSIRSESQRFLIESICEPDQSILSKGCEPDARLNICEHVALFGECANQYPHCLAHLPMMGRYPSLFAGDQQTQTCSLIEPLSIIDVRIRTVISPNLMYGYLCSGSDYTPEHDIDLQLQMMSCTMDENNLITENNDEDFLQLNHIYAFRDSVSAWRRFFILSKNSQSLTVLLIDSGQIRNLNKSHYKKICEIKGSIKKNAPAAVECVICGLSPVDQGQINWPECASSIAHELFANRWMKGKVFASVTNEFGGITIFFSWMQPTPEKLLKDDGEQAVLKTRTVRETMIEKCLAVDNEVPHLTVLNKLFGRSIEYEHLASDHECPHASTMMEDKIVRLLSLATHEGKASIYVVDEQLYASFIDMYEDIQGAADIVPGLKSVSVDQLCLVLDVQKNIWCRCKVIADKCDTRALRTINFETIDYGKKLEVNVSVYEPLYDYVKSLPLQYSQIDGFARVIEWNSGDGGVERFREFCCDHKCPKTRKFMLKSNSGRSSGRQFYLFDYGADELKNIPIDSGLTIMLCELYESWPADAHTDDTNPKFLEKMAEKALKWIQNRMGDGEDYSQEIFENLKQSLSGDIWQGDLADCDFELMCILCECFFWQEHFIENLFLRRQSCLHAASCSIDQLLTVSLRIFFTVSYYCHAQKALHAEKVIIPCLMEKKDQIVQFLSDEKNTKINWFIPLWKLAVMCDGDRSETTFDLIPNEGNEQFLKETVEYIKSMSGEVFANLNEHALNKFDILKSTISRKKTNTTSSQEEDSSSVSESDFEETISLSSFKSDFSTQSKEEKYLNKSFAVDYVKVMDEARGNHSHANQQSIMHHDDEIDNDDARVYNESGVPLPYPTLYWKQSEGLVHLTIRICLTKAPNVEIDKNGDNVTVKMDSMPSSHPLSKTLKYNHSGQSYGFRLKLFARITQKYRCNRLPSELRLTFNKKEDFSYWPKLTKHKCHFVHFDALDGLDNDRSDEDVKKQEALALEMINTLEQCEHIKSSERTEQIEDNSHEKVETLDETDVRWDF